MSVPLASVDATMTAVDMGSGEDKNDPFAFTAIQLTTVTEQRGMHQKNSTPDEVQRPDILDDLCRGLLLQARVDRVTHGRAGESGPPATLVVFGFRFHGLHGDRRFKSATITVIFEDENRRGADCDPTVVALWPNGDFQLGEPTVVQVEDMTAGEVGGNADVPAGAPVVALGGHVTRSWEQKKSYNQKQISKLKGSIFLDFSVREYGPQNAIRLTLSEDTAAATSLVSEFRAAVLLNRKNDTDIFVAKVRMKGKADFMYNLTRAVRDVTPFAPANDPVRFKPGVQFLRSPTGSTVREGNLSADIVDTELSADKLEGLAGLLATTALTVEV